MTELEARIGRVIGDTVEVPGDPPPVHAVIASARARRRRHRAVAGIWVALVGLVGIGIALDRMRHGDDLVVTDLPFDGAAPWLVVPGDTLGLPGEVTVIEPPPPVEFIDPADPRCAVRQTSTGRYAGVDPLLGLVGETQIAPPWACGAEPDPSPLQQAFATGDRWPTMLAMIAPASVEDGPFDDATAVRVGDRTVLVLPAADREGEAASGIFTWVEDRTRVALYPNGLGPEAVLRLIEGIELGPNPLVDGIVDASLPAGWYSLGSGYEGNGASVHGTWGEGERTVSFSAVPTGLRHDRALTVPPQERTMVAGVPGYLEASPGPAFRLTWYRSGVAFELHTLGLGADEVLRIAESLRPLTREEFATVRRLSPSRPDEAGRTPVTAVSDPVVVESEVGLGIRPAEMIDGAFRPAGANTSIVARTGPSSFVGLLWNSPGPDGQLCTYTPLRPAGVPADRDTPTFQSDCGGTFRLDGTCIEGCDEGMVTYRVLEREGILYGVRTPHIVRATR